jgi:hypothetical protein
MPVSPVRMINRPSSASSVRGSSNGRSWMRDSMRIGKLLMMWPVLAFLVVSTF